MFCGQVCCVFSPPCSAVFIRVNLFLDHQVVDIRARSSESQSDSRRKEIRQVLTKQVLSPAFASLLESWLEKWLRHEIMRPGSAVQVIFLLYVPWGRSHSRWCFVACESEFTEWQPAAEELKINLLMANGGSSPCWHFVLQHARRAWVYGNFGSGNLGYPNLRVEYTNMTFAQICALICGLNMLMWVAESQLADFRLSELTLVSYKVVYDGHRPDFRARYFIFFCHESHNNKHIFCMGLLCSEQLKSTVTFHVVWEKIATDFNVF